MIEETLNNLKATTEIGEKIVEITGKAITKSFANIDQIITIYSVSIYTCVEKTNTVKKNFFTTETIKSKEFKQYTIPFFFKTKELAEEFMEYYELFTIKKLTFWDSREQTCYGLVVKDDPMQKKIYLVDDRKIDSIVHKDKSQLQEDGIFNGQACFEDPGYYFMFERNQRYYVELINDRINFRKSFDTVQDNIETHIYKLQKI